MVAVETPDYLNTDEKLDMLSTQELLEALDRKENRVKVRENLGEALRENPELRHKLQNVAEEVIGQLDSSMKDELLDIVREQGSTKWGKQSFKSHPDKIISSRHRSYMGVLCLYDQLMHAQALANADKPVTSGRGYLQDAQSWLQELSDQKDEKVIDDLSESSSKSVVDSESVDVPVEEEFDDHSDIKPISPKKGTVEEPLTKNTKEPEEETRPDVSVSQESDSSDKKESKSNELDDAEQDDEKEVTTIDAEVKISDEPEETEQVVEEAEMLDNDSQQFSPELEKDEQNAVVAEEEAAPEVEKQTVPAVVELEKKENDDEETQDGSTESDEDEGNNNSETIEERVDNMSPLDQKEFILDHYLGIKFHQLKLWGYDLVKENFTTEEGDTGVRYAIKKGGKVVAHIGLYIDGYDTGMFYIGLDDRMYTLVDPGDNKEHEIKYNDRNELEKLLDLLLDSQGRFERFLEINSESKVSQDAKEEETP